MAAKTVVVLLALWACADGATGAKAAGGQLMTYWGQNVYEGSLKKACQTGTYDILAISFVAVFGNNVPPQLNLAGHCDPFVNECTNLTSEIHFCQSSGVKLLISLGGGSGAYALVSEADARSVADYVWNNYLGGHNSTSRPLGPAVLDGVDLDIEASVSPYWPSLAKYLKAHSSDILLTSAPQCVFPDLYMGPGPGSALQTGLFDLVWVQFFNNPPCDFNGTSADALLTAWDQWTDNAIPGGTIVLLGLPATPDAAPAGGFLPTHVLKATVLPHIKKSPKYGGVMLWSRYYDSISDFGATIKSSL